MPYHLLEPEVAGELGPNTEMDTSVHPPRVLRLHYELSDWLGDDLLESFPVFLASEPLTKEVVAHDLTGYTIADAEVTRSPEAEELLGDQEIPPFYWLNVSGHPGVDDFGTTEKGHLVVSDRALAVLRSQRLSNCDVQDYPVT